MIELWDLYASIKMSIRIISAVVLLFKALMIPFSHQIGYKIAIIFLFRKIACLLNVFVYSEGVLMLTVA